MKTKVANIDWFIFTTTVILLVLVSGFLVSSRQGGQWVVPWAFYEQTLPFGIDPRSLPAAAWAASDGILHLSFAGWSLYRLLTWPPVQMPAQVGGDR